MEMISLPLIAISGISFYVGAYHLLIYYRRKQHREDLTFALLCLANSLYAIFCFELYNSASVTEGVVWQKAQFISLALFTTTFLWFIADYTRQKPGIIIYLFTAFYVIAAIVQITDRSSLTFDISKPSIKELNLPSNLHITYYETTLGPFTILQSLVGFLFIAYVLWCGIRFYKGTNKEKAGPLLFALSIMILAGINDTFVSNNVYKFIYLIEYSYLAIIVVMALSLSGIFVDAEKTKEALWASEERFRSIVETTNDWVWEVDRNGVYTYSSPKVIDIIGYTPQEIIGRTTFEFMPESEAVRVGEIFLDAAAHLRPLERLENIVSHKDGRKLVLETSGVPFLDENGNLLGYRGIDRDISERKYAEDEIIRLNAELEQRVVDRTAQLETAIKELEAFSYSVSHDLRAPLRAVDGFSNLLLQNFAAQLPPDAAKYVNNIHEGSQRMGRLIDDLLRLSHLNHRPFTKQNISMENLARQVCQNLCDLEKRRKINIEIDPLPDCMGDNGLMQQVWINLISNALKFSKEKPVTTIRIGYEKKGDTNAYFVKDNGVGFDMQYVDKLFNVFQRLHKTDQFEGTGIGLAIVKRIINRHGGKIWAESEVNEGTTFYFTV
jgi:PAS domain S-box-containing protein